MSKSHPKDDLPEKEGIGTKLMRLAKRLSTQDMVQQIDYTVRSRSVDRRPRWDPKFEETLWPDTEHPEGQP